MSFTKFLMKKIIVLLFVGLCSTAYADVMIFNKSKHDVEITYRYCYMDYDFVGADHCDKNPSKAIIHGQRDPSNKTYLLMNNQPSRAGSFGQRLTIISAIEKDENAVIVSQSNYLPDPVDPANDSWGDCFAENYYQSTDNGGVHKSIMSAAIVLDDMNQSPVITCQAGYSTYYGGAKQQEL